MDFPNSNDIRSSITEIRNIDLTKESSYNEILDIIKNKIKIVPILTRTLKAEDEIFLRSRVHMPTEKKFYKIDDFSYRNDISSIDEYSRCNIPGQQIFYCSFDRPTSYAESLVIRKKPLDIEFVSIGKWKLKKDINIGIIAHPYINGRCTDEDNHYGRFIDSLIDREYKEIEHELKEVLYYFNIEFRRIVKTHIYYKVTAAISNLMFEGVDAIVYPSVPFLGQGYNVALKKQLVEDKSIELEHVMIEKFQRLSSLRIVQDMSFDKQTNKILYASNEVAWD